MNRRRFLHGAGALGGALLGSSMGAGLLGACSSTSRTRASTTTARVTAEALLDSPASASPIDHVVVLMLENRSFDHWLGWLADDETYLEAGRSRHGGDFDIAGVTQQRFTGDDGEVPTRHLLDDPDQDNPHRGCGHGDPGHTWHEGRVQRDEGFLADGSGNDNFALGYYRGSDLPFTAQLANRFTVCDQSHASLLAATLPNRMYLQSAQAGDAKVNLDALPLDGGFSWDTIWDRLDTAGVSAGYFSSDVPMTFLWGDRLKKFGHKVEDYFELCERGRLPSVSFVDPSFIGPTRTDNHPLGDIRSGERFARDVFAAFARSPHWANGLFVLTFDEWGGFFDHVSPPTLADDRASADDDDNFGQAGFRVPTILASPYSRRGWVDHQLYDHTSILRFLEWRFLGAPAFGAGGRSDWSLTSRDRNANNLATSLVAEADREIGFDLDVEIDDISEACADEDDDGFIDLPSPQNRAEPDPDQTFLEELAESGYFEERGIDTTPSPMARGWVEA